MQRFTLSHAPTTAQDSSKEEKEGQLSQTWDQFPVPRAGKDPESQVQPPQGQEVGDQATLHWGPRPSPEQLFLGRKPTQVGVWPTPTPAGTKFHLIPVLALFTEKETEARAK